MLTQGSAVLNGRQLQPVSDGSVPAPPLFNSILEVYIFVCLEYTLYIYKHVSIYKNIC
jgi:hypothetical protein